MQIVIAGALAFAILARVGSPQEPPRLSLRPRDAALSEEFSRLVSMRELTDGRVLLSDNRDNRVVAASFESNSVVPLGRVGSGPSEFRRAGLLIALPQDSSILADPGNGRWLLLEGTRIVATIPATDRVVAIATIPGGADSTGNVLAHRFNIRPDTRVDSTVILRVSRRATRVDTIAKLRTMPMQVGRPVTSTETRVTVQHIEVAGGAAGEQALLFNDGWIAIARLDPYRIEWHSSQGPPLKGPPLHVDAANEAPFTSVSSILGEPAPALLGTPEGYLVVKRAPAASPRHRYDVIDRHGTLYGQLELASDQQVLGFGTRHIYIITADADGIQRVSRHPWP